MDTKSLPSGPFTQILGALVAGVLSHCFIESSIHLASTLGRSYGESLFYLLVPGLAFFLIAGMFLFEASCILRKKREDRD